MAYKRLGDILLQAGIITDRELETYLLKGKEDKKRLGKVLLDAGVITEIQLIDLLKLQLGVDYIDLTTYRIPTVMAQVLPKNLAKKYTVVPVKIVGDSLYLAMADPLNFMAIEEVKKATKKRIIPMIAMESSAERAIRTLYGNEGVNRAIDEMQKSIGIDELSVKANVETGGDEAEQAAPAIRVVNSILERGIAEKASDIHMEPREDGLYVRMRIDGVLHQILTVPATLQNSIISRVKIISNLDIAERRIPQDGRATIKAAGVEMDMRISTLPTKYGEKLVIRFLEKSKDMLSSTGIGLKGEHLKQYESLIQNSNGVILIAGPTGSGKSTTMYTMISDLNEEEVNLVTLEDPIEYDLPGINQVQINEKVGMTFASGLRAILRQDPDIIAVGEIRDGETAEIAMRSAITGHLVLSTIHTNSSIATIDRLLDIGVEPYLITGAVKGIISQRLVRKICPKCKTSYIPSLDELSDLKLDNKTLLEMGFNSKEEIKFFKGEGCPHCLNTGYKGRSAAFEILTLTSDVKQLIRERASYSQLTEAISKSGYKPMIDHVRRLVISGETTLEEAKRILHTTEV